MTCIHDGILRSHVDGELAGAELAEVSQHLVSCSDCRDRMEKLRAETARMEEWLGTLVPSADNVTTNSAMAYAKFSNQFETVNELRAGWITRLFAPRWRPAWGPGSSRSMCHDSGECESGSHVGAASPGHVADSENSGGHH